MKRIALVTGANRGIGREVCRQLVARDVHTILCARDEKSGLAAAASLGARAVYIHLDVTDPASIEAMAAAVEARWGALDVLVNNAAVSNDAAGALDSDFDNIVAAMETNLYGPWRVARALAPLLRRSDDARIINVSSGMGSLGNMRGNHAGYRVSKAALNALTLVLARELDGTAIVNAVTPGWVRTEMGGRGADLSVEEGAAPIVRLAVAPSLPTGRYFNSSGEAPW